MDLLPVNLEGECVICGTPGIVGMHCSNPECSGEVLDLVTEKTKIDDDEHYDKGVIAGVEAEDGEPEIASLEELAEKEDKEDDEW